LSNIEKYYLYLLRFILFEEFGYEAIFDSPNISEAVLVDLYKSITVAQCPSSFSVFGCSHSFLFFPDRNPKILIKFREML